MKKLSVLFTLLLFSMSLSAQSLQGIRVTGKASLEQAPDVFQVSIVVTERGTYAEKTKVIVDNKAEQVTRAAISLGIKAEKITSTQIQIMPIYPEKNTDINRVFVGKSTSQGPVLVEPELAQSNSTPINDIEFQVSRTIEINLPSVTLYEKLLDKAIKVGVSNINPVRTSISDAEQLYQKALSIAIADAKQKATEIALQLNVSVGSAVYVEESSYRAPARMRLAAESSGSFHQGFTGLDTITAEVSVLFSILPK